MVVFTCNHCGDSLQKPRVEKHYMITCRAVESLTCMDCLKDFKGEEYMAHTKCVSEAQRYAAKGSVVQEVKKGEAKQENWTNLIRDVIIKDPDVPVQYLTHLEALSTINNVPRTKDKFLKFMQNSGHRCPHKSVVNGLWEFITKYKEKLTEGSNQKKEDSSQPEKKKRNKEKNGKKKTDNGINENVGDAETSAVDLSESNSFIKNDDVQVKSKKRKSDAANNKVEEETCKKQKENGVDNEIDNPAVGIKKKDKKKKKKNSTNANEEVNEPKGNQEGQNQEITKGKDESNEGNDSSVRVKSKKRKSDASGNKADEESCKKQNVNGCNNEVDNSAVEMKKEKKKKKKRSLVLENSNSKIGDDGSKNSQEISISNNVLENQEITTENNDEDTKNKKQCRASDFFIEKNGAVDDNDGNDSTVEEKVNEVEKDKSEIPSVENSLSESFSVRDKILDVLNSKSSISLSKLQKRLLKAYKKSDATISEEKLLKKCNKTLKKLDNVEVDDDNIVKLISR